MCKPRACVCVCAALGGTPLHTYPPTERAPRDLSNPRLTLAPSRYIPPRRSESPGAPGHVASRPRTQRRAHSPSLRIRQRPSVQVGPRPRSGCARKRDVLRSASGTAVHTRVADTRARVNRPLQIRSSRGWHARAAWGWGGSGADGYTGRMVTARGGGDRERRVQWGSAYVGQGGAWPVASVCARGRGGGRARERARAARSIFVEGRGRRGEGRGGREARGARMPTAVTTTTTCVPVCVRVSPPSSLLLLPACSGRR